MAGIGIVVAMLPEAACLSGSPPPPGSPVSLHPGISLHVCGIGAERAARAAEQLVAGGVHGLLSFGVAGALVPGYPPGAVLVPECVVTAAGPLPADTRWRLHVLEQFAAAGLEVIPGNMTEAEAVATTPALKSALGARRNATAADMESAAVMRVATRHGLRALVLRVIMDPLDLEIPPFVLARSDMYGRAHMAGMVLDLLLAPARLPALWRLSRALNAAATSMRHVGRLLPMLHPGHDALAPPR